MRELLSVEKLQCAYEGTPVLRSVSFSIEEGEIACLLGPSGCGKTTVLRAIAGFIEPEAGAIRINGEVISDEKSTLPPEKRGMGMVFQDYALFPHLTIAENIAFGLKGKSRSEKQKAVEEVLNLVELPDLGKRYPHELSGGQQQRVALARALAPKPRLLLMDEPFSNLDTDLRRQLSAEMRRILKKQQIASIMVTHDQQEAFTISDRLGVLSKGEVQQWGTPEELFYQPATPEVASFVGKGVMVSGKALAPDRLSCELGELEFAEPFGADDSEGRSVRLFLRPTDIQLSHEGGVSAEVLTCEFQGSQTLYSLRLDSGLELQAVESGMHRYPIGEQVSLRVAPHRPIVFFDR
ncbi:ABC transporter ATP-binding protein [Marinobacterium mangrovicola]|uniref:Iron(III) transport system ATP-binding protein n=1 Tax=Marinobacterium mangrovicola TaxID=1476959 RepID=A0A4R1HB86_9GAMM|nr:ABC transporter ATP-binding protein [Marinobacterium mangrovicola]TCK16429.1 iron(III) transport system ATP-binding protein [Marinobacterium mangrovicola]